MKRLAAVALSALLLAGCGVHRVQASAPSAPSASVRDDSRGDGLVENTAAPFSQRVFLATGRWSGVVNGRLTVAYAGQAGLDDARTGQLRVDWFGRSVPIVVKTYPRVGALRIISVTDGVLVARDRQAVAHVVDLKSIVR